jgi:hypothetical protein
VYYIPSGEAIPFRNEDRQKREIGYYHWVPITLILQALLFIAPNWIWNHFSQSGQVFGSILRQAVEVIHGGDEGNFEDSVTNLAEFVRLFVF